MPSGYAFPFKRVCRLMSGKGSCQTPITTMNLWPPPQDIRGERTFSPPKSEEAAIWIIAIILLPLVVIALSTLLCELNGAE